MNGLDKVISGAADVQGDRALRSHQCVSAFEARCGVFRGAGLTCSRVEEKSEPAYGGGESPGGGRGLAIILSAVGIEELRDAQTGLVSLPGDAH